MVESGLPEVRERDARRVWDADPVLVLNPERADVAPEEIAPEDKAELAELEDPDDLAALVAALGALEVALFDETAPLLAEGLPLEAALEAPALTEDCAGPFEFDTFVSFGGEFDAFVSFAGELVEVSPLLAAAGEFATSEDLDTPSLVGCAAFAESALLAALVSAGGALETKFEAAAFPGVEDSCSTDAVETGRAELGASVVEIASWLELASDVALGRAELGASVVEMASWLAIDSDVALGEADVIDIGALVMSVTDGMEVLEICAMDSLVESGATLEGAAGGLSVDKGAIEDGAGTDSTEAA